MFPNYDDSNPYFRLLPKLGAFEISCNGETIFSKILTNRFPDVTYIAKCAQQLSHARKMDKNSNYDDKRYFTGVMTKTQEELRRTAMSF